MAVELFLLSRVSFRDRDVTGARLRGLLALLAADLRTGCGGARLIDGLWPDEQPERPTKALQVLVSRARALLGADVIASTPTGYRLALAEDQVDAGAVLLRAAASARELRAGDHAAALAHAEAGLAFWDGVPSGEAEPGDPVSALRAERAATFRSLVRARALALSRLGRRSEAVDVLTDLVRERPRDEEVWLELVRCEAETLGPAAALARYEGYRRSLRDALGTDPGPALQAEYQRLLRGAVPEVRQGIVQDPNPLLGRDGDLAAVAGLLVTSRVTSIVGPGGLGKTRLAHAVSRLAEQPIVYVVPLAGVATDDDVAGEVASALGVGEPRRGPGGHPPVPSDRVSGIADALGPGPALLVLDNCEHVLGGVADLVHGLVSATKEVRVLTTSRAPLGLSSESVYALPQLDLATTVELFGQRARAARPGVELSAGPVEELCRHLDGLPLAVELAAARVRVMSVAEINRRLGDRFTLLRGGARDTPERHRTLFAVVDWSWHLLDPAGRAAMRALSVFPAGFTMDAAQRVIGDADALSTLEHLVDQSLLKVTDTVAGARMSMLETVREFSLAHRDSSGETDRVIDGFLAWARDVALAHHESLFGADPGPPLARVRAEQENLLQAHRYALARSDGAAVAATTAVLGGLWTLESNYARMAVLSRETGWLLSHYRPVPELVEVTRTALALCTTYTFLIEGPRAVRSLVALRRLPPAPPDTLARAVAVLLDATAADTAALWRLCDHDEPLLAAAANGIASYLWEREGNPDNALEAAGRMLAALDRDGIPMLRGTAHARLAELCLQAERGEEARRHLSAALPIYEAFGNRGDLVGLKWWLVLANLQLGALDEAEWWLEQSTLDLAGERPHLVSYGLGVRAEIMLARGEVDAGLRLWRRAADLLEEPGDDPTLHAAPPGLDPWTLEVKATMVVAHARHGRSDSIEEVAGELERALARILTEPADRPHVFVMEMPICGAILVALAAMDLDRAARSGDTRAARSGARMTALAERFRFLRGFHPTMSCVRARVLAEEANRPAYDDAVSSYADLNGADLRAAAVELLRYRTGSRL